MFKWTHSEEISTQASAEQIWSMWEDVATWPCWDHELEWVELSGAFKESAVGRMKPKKGPIVTFTLDKVIKNVCFSDYAKLPLTRISFDHEYIGSTKSGSSNNKIRHTVTMSGLLSPFFGMIIGSKIKLHLRDAMIEMSRRALTENKAL
ncbi:hypothetical protein MCU_00899 [Bartonella elizabethae Re6043vi]|uniref:Uncharacterized protein n=2 Tax=Bartonella elizabethae TaxID=807 RepID=J0RCR7_BAREL|nr:hypothetical protein [Bartonella elizabethae]EJF84231.1 hypothetical protein MCU_00899 [Bartonella elizabethae Re6043vi]EJF96526.1 hypothetical protein MEE_00425 [Bartonella elizabethae F9251 = ATCC 49927]VEJ39768.1 Uncharacterised protein [Bartonella elizabethae]